MFTMIILLTILTIILPINITLTFPIAITLTFLITVTLTIPILKFFLPMTKVKGRGSLLFLRSDSSPITSQGEGGGCLVSSISISVFPATVFAANVCLVTVAISSFVCIYWR